MRSVLQTVLLGFVFIVTVWLGFPPVAVGGIGLAAVALISAAFAPRFAGVWINSVALAALWVGSFAVWGSVALGSIVWNVFYAVPAGFMAAAIGLTSDRAVGPAWKGRWNSAIIVWLLYGAVMWLGAGYFQDQRVIFYTGLLATLAVLGVCQLWFSLRAISVQFVNTLILVLVGLPLVDLALRPQSRIAVRPETARLYYSYDAAKGDPEAFARWEEYYSSQFDQLGLEVFMPDPEHVLPFRLRPSSHGTFVNCPISINSLGFRGPEFAAAKDGAYRIVVLGESTTFGMTIGPDDKPWPELLEKIIRERIKSRRPVQVINAGVPAYTIFANLSRLPHEILPLHPDMIISYHGANAFNVIEPSLLPSTGPAPPVYEERPIKLAADFEHRLRMMSFQRHARRPTSPSAPPVGNPLETKYAAAYEQLIECARTNRIRLALANFSMAVNQESDPKVIDYYRGGGDRSALGFIRANAVHSVIVSGLAAKHPEVWLVDTHPHLDGEHEKFIDVIHLSAEGERQLAENVFAGIRRVLESDLAP